MSRTSAPSEPTVERRVFEAWSIEIPAAFAETFIREDDYWHGYDEHRSVSLSSIALDHHGVPASATRSLSEFGLLDGSPVTQMPPGLLGAAATSAAEQPARASRALTGMLATHGRLLIVTITSDDLEWAMHVWLSIRSHPAPRLPITDDRTGRAARRLAH